MTHPAMESEATMTNTTRAATLLVMHLAVFDTRHAFKGQRKMIGGTEHDDGY